MSETTITHGWFAVKRGITSHPIFHKRPDRAFVWLWMLETAAYKDTRQDANGKPVEVKRGQLLTSYRQIEAATGVSVKTVRGLIDLLKAERAIGIDLGTGRMLITICNYDKYQSPKGEEGTDRGTARAQQGHTKETKEQDNKRTPLPPKGGDEAGFEAFWAAYPHRPGAKKNRKGALAKWNKLGVAAEVIMAGVERMKADPTVARGYARDAVTWLNQEGWTDEVAAPRPGLRVVHSGPRIGDVKIINGNPMEYAGNGTGWIRIYA